MVDYVTWKHSYSVNDPSLDAEHKQILDTINQLYLPMQGRRPGLAAERLLGSLIRDMRDHFDHEEEQLKDTAYPSFVNHKALHDDMMQRSVDLQTQLMSLPPCDVLTFLKDWWLEHIQVEDKKYVAHLEGQRAWNDVHLCQ
jgi:hemerythrin